MTGRKSVQYASGWVDDEALHEALSSVLAFLADRKAKFAKSMKNESIGQF